MGCYLSKVNDKVYISEGKGRNFQYASASCQGWRREQEDAEVCLSEFDDNASLFILCDGHGGAEVAKYTVVNLPNFIKRHKLYKEGKYEELLSQVLVDFDAHLRTDEVMGDLEDISRGEEVPTFVERTDKPKSSEWDVLFCRPSSSKGNGSNSVGEDVDTETLRREAQVPLDELIDMYADEKTINRIMFLRELSVDGDCVQTGAPGISDSDHPEPSSSKTTEDGPSSTSSDMPKSGLDLLKKVYMDYFEESEDDSEFNGSDDSEEDEDSDDDGDDERDEEASGERSKKLLSKKQRRLAKDQSESSSGDNEEDDESDDDDDDDGDDDDDDDVDGDEDEEDENENEEDDDELTDPVRNDSDSDEVFSEEDTVKDTSDVKPKSMASRFLAMKNLETRLAKGQAVKEHRAGMDSGCTVVVALVKDNKLYVASAGDSRCIMIMRDGKCQPMSFDHKPEDPIEHERITKAGGLVQEGRVNGGLNLSRALGDFTYKDPDLAAKDQMITPCPDVKVADLDPDKVEYIFLACDGIWNSYDSDYVAEFIQRVAPTTSDLANICAALFKLCLAPNCHGDGTGCDNMTCILVRYDSSSVTESSTNNQIDLKLSSTTKNTEESMDEEKKECEQSQSSKRQPAGHLEGASKRRCMHLLPKTSDDGEWSDGPDPVELTE